ncbi:MAG: SpoIID/LytB domain-containing protein [Elusimicrobiota bacterium]
MKIHRGSRILVQVIIGGLLLGVFHPAFALSRVPKTIIKVGFLTGENEIHVKNYSKFEAVDINTSEKEILEPGKNYTVQKSGDGLSVGELKFGSVIRFVSADDTEYIRINGRRYRDTVIIRKAENGTLTAVNELGVDGYLFGVLPVEVSPEWPIESLKAQAVVSRTFIMNNIGKYESKGYDLSADVFSQMYKGVEVENPSSNRAVRKTSGQVLTYNGELARAFFFSSCGGYTSNIKNVWGSYLPYMKGVTCGYCRDSPRYRWEKRISPSVLQGKLKKKGYDIGKIKDIKFLSRTSSGRIDELLLIHSKGRTALTGHSFRMAIGPDIIKSTLMSIKRDEKKFSFYGRGWGHGVGMCQWGAKGMAEEGYKYDDILRFYFPGTQIEKWAY